jgi:signal transduction histidine kinase
VSARATDSPRAPRDAGSGTRWGETVTLVAAGAVGAVALLAAVEAAPSAPALRWVADGAAGAGALALLRLRRRRPALVAVVVVLLSTVCSSVLGSTVVAVVALGGTRRWRPVGAVGVLFVATTVVDDLVAGRVDTALAQATLTAALYAACVGLGAYRGSERDRVQALRDRAEAAEREQVSRAERARVEERTRIAREMHDVLAHRISLVAMHAGALSFRPDLPDDEQAAAATIVRDNATLALAELRQVLGVLRAPDGPEGTTAVPQPSLQTLDDLLVDARAAGAHVDLELAGTVARRLPALPEHLSRDAYRIVQEGLTNARRHAPGAAVHVRVEGAPDGLLVVEVRNERPAPDAGTSPRGGAGVGLVGVAERARLAGGGLDHGPADDGGYRLRAVLPWPEEVAGG